MKGVFAVECLVVNSQMNNNNDNNNKEKQVSLLWMLKLPTTFNPVQSLCSQMD